MLIPVALKAINHLLAGEEWAQLRLQAYAGQSLRIELGQFQLPLEIGADGFLVEQAPGTAPSVTISLPNDTPARLIVDRESLLSRAQISGSADFAECLSFVFKHLRWDPEHDLAQVVGDIAARRIVEGGRRFAKHQVLQARNLVTSVVEFFVTDDRTLIDRENAVHFGGDVDNVSSAVEQLEVRIRMCERFGE